MVAVRDLKCRNDIAEMAELGKFEQEFIVYGCAYLRDGKMEYQVSGDGMDLFRFLKTSSLEKVYAGPVMDYLYRIAVPSGMTEEYQWKAKLMLAERMRTMLPKELLTEFQTLAAVPNTDAALPLFRELQKKMVGHFDRDLFQLLNGLFLRAFQQKKLSDEHYTEMVEWLQYLYAQMEDDVVIKKNVARTFYGFAYRETNGQIKYYANAVELEAYKQQQRVHLQGKTVSPMLQKTYYFEELPILANVRKGFLSQMEQWMDEEYWSYLDAIDNLPSAVDKEAYEALQKKAEEGPEGIQQYLKYYRHLLFA